MPGSSATLEFFQPLVNFRTAGGDESIGYFDGRLGAGSERTFGNFGAGARHYVDYAETIVDANLWYDFDQTDANLFHQITIGTQIQSKYASFRIHGYTPIIDNEKPREFTPASSTPFYSGNQLAFERFRVDEVALSGFDAELGLILPGPSDEIRMYAGLYSFEDDDGSISLDGVSGRLEVDVLPGMRASLLATDDDVNDLSFLFTLTWEMSSYAQGTIASSVRQRLGETNNRNYNMVIRDRNVLSPLIATSPTTGNAIQIAHASSAGMGVGSGTAADPFTSLSDAAAEADADPDTNIILAHAGSVFDGQGITLPEGIRFLGEGVDHTIETNEFGTIVLPQTSASTATPIIQNAPGSAITLGNGVEVNNFDIRTPAASGLLANGLTDDATVDNVSVDGGIEGVLVRNSSGGADVTFNELSIANTTGDSISIETNNSNSSVNFTGTTMIDNSTGAGIDIRDNDGRANFDTLQITNYQQQAINILRSDGTVTFAQPLTFDNSSGTLSETIRIEQSRGAVTFDSVTISDTDRAMAGLPAVHLFNNTNTTSFDTLEVTTDMGTALEARYFGVTNGTLRIDNGTISSANATAVVIDNVDNTDITLQSISATNTPVGVMITDAGNFALGSQFRVVGNGSAAGSGGVMTGVNQGVIITDTEGVLLNFLQIDSTTSGVSVTDSNDVILNGLTLTSSSDNWVGIDVTKNFTGGGFDDTQLTNNTITGPGNDQFGIDLTTDRTLPATSATISGNMMTLSGTGTTGINLHAVGVDFNVGEEGQIHLRQTSIDNVITATSPFIAIEDEADITGRILINGVLMP